jgi:LruC domain-containing protein
MRAQTVIFSASILLALPAFGQADPRDGGFVEVPAPVLETVGRLLPERSNAGASFVSDLYSPNLLVTERAQVYVTFVWEGAGYRNSFGYFTYREEPDGRISIVSRDLVFPDASLPPQGKLATGVTQVLRDASGEPRVFEPGEKIGFFVVADGWSRDPRIRSWRFDAAPIPGETPLDNAGISLGSYTTIDRVNPELLKSRADLTRHVAMLRLEGIDGFLGGEDFFLVGIEDLNRATGADNDFNDVVVIVTASPIEAVTSTPVPVYRPGDPDGDGVEELADAFPNDPERAFINRFPAAGFGAVAFEDLYPNAGDADFNDAVVAYEFQVVSDSKGRVKDILGTFHLLARGASLDHRLGLHLPGLPEDAKGVVEVERFLSGDDLVHEIGERRSIEEVIVRDLRRIPDLFPSTRAALDVSTGDGLANTWRPVPERSAASARIRIAFDEAIDANRLGSPPYDLYFSILIARDQEWDVHLPGKPGFAERPHWLPNEDREDSFLDENGMPFLLEVPATWKFPLERTHVEKAYPAFATWKASRGKTDADWYRRPTADKSILSDDLSVYVPVREWMLALPPR